MKVALVHDYLKEYGGAERVLEALHELFPDAPVFTTLYLPSYLGPHENRFKDWKINTSFLQYFPFKQKMISFFRLLSPLAFKSFDFSKYDIIFISATGAYFPNAVKKNKAIQICYCHTPPRYLYGYATARDIKKSKAVYMGIYICNHFLRMLDFSSAQNPDFFIANSYEVKERIKKFYKREAKVIYPPVDISFFHSNIKNFTKSEKEFYYLTGGRLARAKNIHLIIQAFLDLKIPLKIFGRGFAGYERELKLISKYKKAQNIEFLGEISDEKKCYLMKNAKAFVFASLDEDFGITPVEAMAAGTPVIAYKSGGVKETIIEGKTGIFFNELSVESIKESIKKFEAMKFDSILCQKQAEKFSKENFKKRIKQFIDEVMK